METKAEEEQGLRHAKEGAQEAESQSVGHHSNKEKRAKVGGLKILGRKINSKRKFSPDIPADIRRKTSVRPSKSWKEDKHFGADSLHGRP